MKKLLLILSIVFIGLFSFFHYRNNQRFKPPGEYDYKVSDSIDVVFYDPALVSSYYQQAYEIGAYARRMWRNAKIDVRFPNDDPESIEASDHYTRMVSQVKRTEEILKYGYSLKASGFNNAQVREIIANGLSPVEIRSRINEDLLGLQLGNFSEAVWKLQKELNTRGYQIPEDGKFGTETQVALVDFQTKNKLFPSGIVEKSTLRLLFK